MVLSLRMTTDYRRKRFPSTIDDSPFTTTIQICLTKNADANHLHQMLQALDKRKLFFCQVIIAVGVKGR